MKQINYDCEDMQQFKCGHCGGEKMFKGEPDSCLGLLPGVVDACCGHGDRSRSYIHFQDGTVVSGFVVSGKMDPSEEIWVIDESKIMKDEA